MSKLPEEEVSPAVTSLGRLVARLALDEVLFERFENDPAGVIREAGLTDDERLAIESGNWSAIRQCINPGKPLGDDDVPPGG